MTQTSNTQYKHYKNRSADERQGELHKKFPADSFLGDAKNVDHFIQWVTFFRRNLHRFVTDYLGIKLHMYQAIALYLMGVCNLIVIIASRASAKSFLTALYSCCICILYPNSMVVLTSATKNQARLLVSEKIEKELMSLSPVLKKEILSIKNNQNEIIVKFRNHSTITVVIANDNARGYRSTVACREEFRMIDKTMEDGVISPFQIIRQTPYMKDSYYADIPELQEEPVDVYISSSWLDNGHWMWTIVDNAYDEMIKGKPSALLAFDEAIALKHKIKTMRYFQTQKKKQDRLTWELEFLNTRLKENTAAFFTYRMLQQNQRSKQLFYPRTLTDFRAGRRNPFEIVKQKGEIRLVSCDMAFIENEKNDNSIFTCMRLLPECTTYSRDETDEVKIDSGYRRIVSYIESVQGGDITKQAVRIRELYEDFGADYIVLDLRNAGIAVYDTLAKVMYDEDRGVEYPPLKCMNDDSIANRIKVEGAKPCIYVINATQKLNSDIAFDFRNVLQSRKIDFLVSFEKASEEILPNIKEYVNSPDAATQAFYEAPFLETQALISETTDLVYEKKEQTGAIVIHEKGSNRKDRYTSCSYGSYFTSMLEKDLLSNNDDYEFSVFIN